MATTAQRLAASALIVSLERICSTGVLSEDDERDTRLLICRACRAFNVPTIAERPTAKIIRIGDHSPELFNGGNGNA